MSMDEAAWRERAQSAEARIATMKDQYEPAIERVQNFKTNFGVKEKSDGTIVIDFEKMVSRLPLDQALELRAVIDEIHRISGAPGEKPRVRMPAKAAAGGVDDPAWEQHEETEHRGAA